MPTGPSFHTHTINPRRLRLLLRLPAAQGMLTKDELAELEKLVGFGWVVKLEDTFHITVLGETARDRRKVNHSERMDVV